MVKCVVVRYNKTFNHTITYVHKCILYNVYVMYVGTLPILQVPNIHDGICCLMVKINVKICPKLC
jgi:hypothetical protein